MSVKEELKLDLDISEVCLRCTLDTRDKQSERDIPSSEFRFQGRGWKLCYSYYPGDVCQYYLYLLRCSDVPHDPFHVSVQVESPGTGRIAPLLPEVTRFTNEFPLWTSHLIWKKYEDEILPALPEFRLHGVLKLIVVLKLGDCDSDISPTEHSPAAGTRSVSVQTSLLPNATPCLRGLSEDLAQLMVEDSDHDVEFHCRGQTTRAHKLIVCRRSAVIASMLASDMVEGRTGVVKIPDMEPDIFQHFLRYMYSGQLPELTVELALNLYESGDQYAVLGLARRCSEYLVEHLSAENACRVLAVADAHSGEDFKESVIAYMLDNEIPLSGGDWRDFSDAHPKLAVEVLNRFCLKLKQH